MFRGAKALTELTIITDMGGKTYGKVLISIASSLILGHESVCQLLFFGGGEERWNKVLRTLN